MFFGSGAAAVSPINKQTIKPTCLSCDIRELCCVVIVFVLNLQNLVYNGFDAEDVDSFISIHLQPA